MQMLLSELAKKSLYVTIKVGVGVMRKIIAKKVPFSYETKDAGNVLGD